MHCNGCGQLRNGSWQAQVDTMLDLLDKSVVGIEERLGSVLDGIAQIVSALGAQSRPLVMDVGVQVSVGMGTMPPAPVFIDTCIRT